MMGVSLEGGLEFLEFLLPFVDLAPEGFELGLIEGEIEGDQNGCKRPPVFRMRDSCF